MSGCRPATLQGGGRLMLLLAWGAAVRAVLVAGEDVPGRRPPPQRDSAGIGDYEYYYDELPREHLARFGRGAEHVQHVPAHAPRAPEAGDRAVVQRVPLRVPRLAGEVADAAAEAAAAEVRQQPDVRTPQPGSGDSFTGAGEPDQGQGRGQGPEPATELQPPPHVEGPAEDVEAKQAPTVSAAVSDKLTKDDMETANFFWGLGPVYPHLYVYRRVPHLVPLHGWNPYHAYILTHPTA